MVFGLDLVFGPREERKVSLIGTGSDYLPMNPLLKLVKGRFFSADDDKEKRAVIVLEKEAAKELFGQQNPVGQRVRMSNISVVVIGVVEQEVTKIDEVNKLDRGGGQNLQAYLPIRFLHTLMDDEFIEYLEIQAVSNETVNPAALEAVQYMNRKHNHTDHYRTSSMQVRIEQFNKNLGILTAIFSVIGGISLLVGGIGVMNIMLVSVTERTREIGVRKALGAQRKDILFQFLIESVIVCLIGGTIGVLKGLGAASLAFLFVGLPLTFSSNSVLIALGFSSVIGVFFGMYPANQAAKLNPIEALRYKQMKAHNLRQ